MSVTDDVARQLGRRLYEVYASERWPAGPLPWEALSGDLQGVWTRTAARLMDEAREQREEWTRSYVAAEAERIRERLRRGESFVDDNLAARITDMVKSGRVLVINNLGD